MNDSTVTLQDLCVEMRKSALTDLDFAQRVALVCCHLIESNSNPLAAIHELFGLR